MQVHFLWSDYQTFNLIVNIVILSLQPILKLNDFHKNGKSVTKTNIIQNICIFIWIQSKFTFFQFSTTRDFCKKLFSQEIISGWKVSSHISQNIKFNYKLQELSFQPYIMYMHTHTILYYVVVCNSLKHNANLDLSLNMQGHGRYSD